MNKLENIIARSGTIWRLPIHICLKSFEQKYSPIVLLGFEGNFKENYLEFDIKYQCCKEEKKLRIDYLPEKIEENIVKGEE